MASWRSISLALGQALIASLLPAAARAVTPEAEALFRDGRRLMAEGKTAEACAAFAQSYAADPSSGTLLNLAFCHETQGRTATAWSEYTETERLAEAQGRQDRAETAKRKIAELDAVLPRLTVTVSRSVPGLTITTEGGVIATKDWGAPVSLDPGVHRVTASAPGYRSWVTTVEIKEADQRTITVPPLDATAAVPPNVSLLPSAGLSRHPGATPRTSRADLYLAAAGGLLAAAGAAFYVVAYDEFDSAKQACLKGVGCSQAERDSRISTIDTWRDLAIGSWVAGGLAVLASGLHYWVHQHSRSSMTVAVDPWNTALILRGSF
ncbi:MAG TPA: hypothetical protein VHO67_00120 [Polyangia bacterium]|nr:hypothetical protein [Polyangia bacterium]